MLIVSGTISAAVKLPEGYFPGLSPTAPTGLNAYREGSEIYLNWNENPEPGTIGYIVYRSLAKAYGYYKLNANDGIDNDFDGEIDETIPDYELVTGIWYEDKTAELDPDRAYYYKVTAVVDGYFESNWSEPADSGVTEGGDLEGCFIATAAYGDAFAPEVQSLRTFRDKFLINNAPGKMFVRMYYKTSPPAARVLNRHPALRCVVRKYLSVVVFLCKTLI